MKRIKNKNINIVDYWNAFANEAYKEADRKRGGNKCKFSTVIKLIPHNSDILDIGCLNGNFYNFINENKHSINSFTGIDFSTELIKMANERFPNQKWIVSDCHKLPFEDNSFDVVTAMEILEHIDNPEIAIQEMKRVCRKEGLVIVTTPNEERIKDLAHIWSFTSLDIFNMLFKISKNVQVLLTCSNNRNIVGQAVIDYESYF